MNELLRALLLGIIQGLTEFLPVSSSGHLELAKYFLGDHSLAEQSMAMTVSLHAATALSTLVVFRKDVAQILGGLLRRDAESLRFTLFIVLSMIPAAIVGLLWEEQIEQLFSRNIPLVASMLFITGLLLFLADKARDTRQDVNPLKALLVGVAQAIAILPGISRSGATISTSVLLKIDRQKAARFSFLMVVPLILAKMAKDLMDAEGLQAISSQILPLSIGFIAAFLTGLLACKWMIALVQNAKLKYFAYYCFGVALLSFFLYKL